MHFKSIKRFALRIKRIKKVILQQMTFTFSWLVLTN
jgi:hypothetical protein